MLAGCACSPREQIESRACNPVHQTRQPAGSSSVITSSPRRTHTRLILLFLPMGLTATRRSTTTTPSVSTRRSWKGRSSSRGTSTDTPRRRDETRRMCRVLRVPSIPCAHNACTVHAATLRITQDLIKKLLTADLTKRLGNLKAGADDVKKHKWFTACMPPTDFEALSAGKGEAPIKARRASHAPCAHRVAPHLHDPLEPLHPIGSLQAPLTTPNPPLEPLQSIGSLQAPLTTPPIGTPSPHSLQAPLTTPTTREAPNRRSLPDPPSSSYGHTSPRCTRARVTPPTSTTIPTRLRAVRSRAIQGTTSSSRTSDQRATSSLIST